MPVGSSLLRAFFQNSGKFQRKELVIWENNIPMGRIAGCARDWVDFWIYDRKN